MHLELGLALLRRAAATSLAGMGRAWAESSWCSIPGAARDTVPGDASVPCPRELCLL